MCRSSSHCVLHELFVSIELLKGQSKYTQTVSSHDSDAISIRNQVVSKVQILHHLDEPKKTILGPELQKELLRSSELTKGVHLNLIKITTGVYKRGVSLLHFPNSILISPSYHSGRAN